MCDTWLDVLVAEACRVDDRHRPHGGHGGDHPWFTPRTRSPWADLPAVDHELSDRLRAGAERAGLVRGFLSQRYGAVLEREHPLLHRGWFAERGRRLLPFMVDKDLAAALITQPSPAAPDLTARWACVVPTLHIRPGRPAAPPTWSAVSAAAEFRDLCDALTALAQVARIAQDHYNDDPLCAAVADAVAAAVPWVHPTAHDLPSMTTGLEEVVAAVRAADGTVWRRLGLTRPVVLQLASRLIMQVSTLHRRHHDRSDMPASPPPSPIDAPLHAVAGLLARALAAIDLKLVLLRCSLQDLHDLAHDRADTAALGPQPLVALQEVMARHKYGTRLLFLHRACAFWTALLPAAQASGSPPVPDPAAAAVAELDSAAHEAIAAIATPGTEARWRRRAARGLAPWRTVESWNLPYYAACAYAATIPDHPDQADGEADPFDDWTPGGADRDSLITAQYERWCRAYDRHALLAVQQLDRAVEQRARAASSANAKGVADWILGEDPDLDLLRRHPRFRRWAAHHFQVTLLPDWHSRGFAEMRAARRALSVREVTIGPAPYVTVAEQCSLGVLGCAEPWNRENVRWGLAHGHYLTIGLQLAVPAAVRYLHSLADKVDATDPDAARREQNDRLALTVATYGQELHRFWSCLPMYRLLSWQPEFRLQLSQSLRRLADLDGHMLPGFPREFEVLQVARFLDYQVIDAALQQRVRGGLEHADQLASAAVPAASTLPQAPYLGASNPARQAALLRQAALDLGGLLADFQKALGTPSSHH